MGELAECIFSGITPKAGGDAYTEDDDGILFIKSGSLSYDGTLSIDNESKIKKEIHNGIMKSSKLQKQDVLIAIVGATIGKIGLYQEDREANINQAISAVRLQTDKILPEFLICYLLSNMGQTYLEYLKRPVARANINLQEIAEIQVPVIPIEKQKKIVKIFYGAQHQYKQILKYANNILSSLNQYILEALHISISQYNFRLCSAVHLKDIKQDSTFSVEYYHPERMAAIQSIHSNSELRVEKLSALVDFCREIVNSSESGEPYLGLSGVESQTGELSGIIEEARGQAFSYQENDILYGRLRPYLNKVWWAEESGICSTEFHVMRVKNESTLLPEYLSEIMRSDLILSQTKHMMTGNTHPRISNEDVKSLCIPIPAISIQRDIVKEINSRRSKVRHLRQEAEKEWTEAKAQFEKELLGE